MMMKKTFLFLLTLLTGMGTASAADELTVDPISIPQEGKAMLTIGFNFDVEDKYPAYQFELVLPDGISLVTDYEDNPLFTLGECHDKSHKVNSSFESNIWTFVCKSDDAINLKGKSGVLMNLLLKADSKLVKGDIKEGTLKTIRFSNNSGSESISLSDVNFNITITDKMSSRVTLDEASTTAPEAATFADVTVRRAIKGGEWNTIVLPFAMNTAQLKEAFGNDVKLADFVGYKSDPDDEAEEEVNSIEVQFAHVSSLEANHPYIIKTASDMTEFNVDDVTIAPVDKPAVDKGSGSYYKTFMGTYKANKKVPTNALFINGNKFWYATGDTKRMKAFRAYFQFYQTIPNEESSRISMVFDDAEATGIATVSKAVNNNDNNFYNLQGQRISQPSKGIFIKGNKKVVKK